MSKHTELQTQGHLVQACDATTGHSVANIAMCNDAETAKHLVRRFNNHDKLVSALRKFVDSQIENNAYKLNQEFFDALDGAEALLQGVCDE